MKFAVIGIVALALLGGGGYAAYSFLNKPAVASAPMNETAQATHDAKLALAKEAEAVAAARFVPMDVLVLPVIDDSGIVQNISLVISLEVADEITALEVTNLIPRLKDAYIQDMYGALNRKTIIHNGVLQVAPVKDRISTKVVGENKIKSVLLQVVQQKRV
jgi:flagellar FliL protein